MTRTAKYKAIYFAIVAAIVVAGAVAGLLLETHPLVAITFTALIVLLLIPGRVQRYFWFDMLAGLRHLNCGNYAESRMHSEHFLTQLQARPWLRHLIWLGTSRYSRNIEALTRNNLGAALLLLGDMAGARQELERAIALDPQCPLPYQNMGTLLLHSGPSTLALPWLDKAESLGLTDSWSDRNAGQAIKGAGDQGAAAGIPPPPVPEGDFLVVLLDDQKVPFEFAVACLEQAFGLTGIEAIRIAAAVSRNGEAPCAGFASEPEAKAAADHFETIARDGGHTLHCAVRRRVG